MWGCSRRPVVRCGRAWGGWAGALSRRAGRRVIVDQGWVTQGMATQGYSGVGISQCRHRVPD